jgi:hypothetical protein
MIKSLLNRFHDWYYEDEYRMIIFRDDEIRGLLSYEEFNKGLVNYRKRVFGGIVFGLKINYDNAKLVCENH